MMAKTTLTVDIEYDLDTTDPESLASAMDHLLKTALSIPGVMEEYGGARIGEFFVAGLADNQSGFLGEPDEAREVRRWAIYSPDMDRLLTTQVYDRCEDAFDDASQVDDVLVLPLVYEEFFVKPDSQSAPHDSEEAGHDHGMA